MKREEFDEFALTMASLSELYGRAFSEITLTLWWNSLRDYDMRSVSKAIERHVANPDSGKFIPKPADIIRLLEGGHGDQALVAWSKVDRAVRQVGTYQSVVFDDPTIHAVIHDMGGWIRLGTLNEDEWPFVAKEFANRFRAYRTTGLNGRQYPRYLPGIAESSNSQHGKPVEAPLMIGDSKACMTVYRGGVDRVTTMVCQLPKVARLEFGNSGPEATNNVVPIRQEG